MFIICHVHFIMAQPFKTSIIRTIVQYYSCYCNNLIIRPNMRDKDLKRDIRFQSLPSPKGMHGSVGLRIVLVSMTNIIMPLHAIPSKS